MFELEKANDAKEWVINDQNEAAYNLELANIKQ